MFGSWEFEVGFEMGFLSSVLGFFGFGVGISIGLIAGYFLFIYFQPSDVKVLLSFSPCLY